MALEVHYDICALREEARQLVLQGKLSRYRTLSALCEFIPPRDWILMKSELESNDFLPRDRIIDLIGHEDWLDD